MLKSRNSAFFSAGTKLSGLLLGFQITVKNNRPCIAVAYMHDAPDAPLLGTSRLQKLVSQLVACQIT